MHAGDLVKHADGMLNKHLHALYRPPEEEDTRGRRCLSIWNR